MKILINSSTNILGMTKVMSRGVFLVIDDTLLAFPFSDDISDGIAKSGVTYNHKKCGRI